MSSLSGPGNPFAGMIFSGGLHVQLSSGSIVSGSIGSGQITTLHLASGASVSEFMAPQVICRVCDKRVPRQGKWVEIWVQHHGDHPNASHSYCPECTNYIVGERRFRTPEEFILDVLEKGAAQSLAPGSELYALADWYEDHGVPAIAEWIRSMESTS